jgi:hypothetical protein
MLAAIDGVELPKSALHTVETSDQYITIGGISEKKEDITALTSTLGRLSKGSRVMFYTESKNHAARGMGEVQRIWLEYKSDDKQLKLSYMLQIKSETFYA